MPIKRPFGREQRATVIYGMLAFVLILVVLQLWLLVSTMNAYLGGDDLRSRSRMGDPIASWRWRITGRASPTMHEPPLRSMLPGL